MKLDTKVKKYTPNYLKHRRFPHGAIAAFCAIAACFIVSAFHWENDGLFASNFAASYNHIFEKGEYWRLFSATFAHADLEHLLSNSLMLVFLSYFVASFYGVGALAAGFFLGAAINLATVVWIGREGSLVGASGVVYYLWGFWLGLYMLIQKNLSLTKRTLRAGAVFLVLLIPTTYSPTTSYFAHYFGFFLGAGAGMGHYFFSSKKPSKEDLENEEETSRHKVSTAHPQPWEKDMPWDQNSQDNAEAKT